VSGRLSTFAEHGEGIDAAIRAYRRVSPVQLEQRLDLSYGTIWDTVHVCIGYRKVCGRWVPKKLTDDHKMTRMATSLRLLQRYVEEGEDSGTATTGDKTWVFLYSPQSKEESMI
jgi:hypothetical protein